VRTAIPFGFFERELPAHTTGAVRDVLAGFTLAAMNVPQALGYT
jgi:hypothetical protein